MRLMSFVESDSCGQTLSTLGTKTDKQHITGTALN